MPLEIERRYLVEGNSWEKFAKNPKYFRQGYLTNNFEEWAVRIRIFEKKRAWITLKRHKDLYTNYEFEYNIPVNEAESIWEHVPYKLTKTRFEIGFNSSEWIIDQFEGENAPLIIAEIELSHIDEIIEIPNWCIREVTGNKKFTNAALAKTPFSTWQI